MKKTACLLLLLAAAAGSASGFTIIDGNLDGSSIYPGTTHSFKVSIPENYDGTPACLYVGLDGILCNAPARIDSLIAVGDIPPMIGVYIQPGCIRDSSGQVVRYNRSNEFDAIDSRFSRFLETELLPAAAEAARRSGNPYSIKPGGENAMIFGLSSGGIGAFTAAWHRPDLFGHVFTGCGTFVPMRGGHNLQAIVRKHEPKPLTVFLQDGYSDTWNPLFGSWFEANTQLGSALRFAGYDYDYDWAEGGHSVTRSSAIFADVMKWMWRNYPSAPSAIETGNTTLAPWLKGDTGWHTREVEVYVQNRGAVYPDGSLIVIPVDNSNYLNQAIVSADGTAYAEQPFYWLHSYSNSRLRLGGMTFDGNGNLWVVTDAGIQVCDQNGRVRAIFDLPAELRIELTDNPENALENSALTITGDGIRLNTPKATYTRSLNVEPPSAGVRPTSQGAA